VCGGSSVAAAWQAQRQGSGSVARRQAEQAAQVEAGGAASRRLPAHPPVPRPLRNPTPRHQTVPAAPYDTVHVDGVT